VKLSRIEDAIPTFRKDRARQAERHTVRIKAQPLMFMCPEELRGSAPAILETPDQKRRVEAEEEKSA